MTAILFREIGSDVTELHDLSRETLDQLFEAAVGAVICMPGKQYSTQHGGPYLERPEQQFANLNARYLPMSYELTRFGARALREASVPVQIAAPPSGPYLHRFMTAAITASNELEATAVGFRFIASGEIVRHPKCPESTRNAANPMAITIGSTTIIPDALYGIDYGGKYKLWALEADRGTEPLTGSAEAVSQAMAKFIDANRQALIEGSPIPRQEQDRYRTWIKKLVTWLFSTDHISIQYSIDYDNVDIRKLSPGTRGIVLLLLYLALDDFDDRPLIIDQPEENLDPRSIFQELVSLFSNAKLKRQVIIVTHNANLVVNTDADQVIVAEVGTHTAGQLPPISYHSGGLEEAEIRKMVCDILEGGEEAFNQRARRLRINLSR